MYSTRSTFARTAANWAVAIGLLAAMLLGAVTPAFAAGGTISSITVPAQITPLAYGTGGTTSYQVSVASNGSISNAVFSVAGLPAGATGAFVPAKLSFTGAQTKITTLTISTTGTTAAVKNAPFTVRYKFGGKVGVAFGTGSLTIAPHLLDVGGTLVQDKFYDGNTNAQLNPACTSTITTDCASLSGVLNGDAVSLVIASGLGGVFSGKDVGVQQASVTGLALSGTGAGNYVLPDPVHASANINPALLTITADAGFKVSGFADPSFTFTPTGFVNGEGLGALTTVPTCNVPVVPHDAAGTYTISCGGGNAQNYDFHYVDGTLTVNAADNVPSNINLSNSSVAEMKPAGTSVGDLTSVDADSSLGEKYSYSLVDTLACAGPDNASFQVDSTVQSTGPVPLKTAAVLHYVTKASYTICVETNDGFGGIFDKQFVIQTSPTSRTFLSQGAYDGWIRESGENTNVGGTMNLINTTLLLGDDSAKKQYKSVLAFATGQLPDNATIYSITIKVKKQSLTTANLFSQLGGLWADIVKPAFGLPALQLTDFQQAVTTTNGKVNLGHFGATPDASGWYSMTLKSSGSASMNTYLNTYLNKLGTTQFRLHFAKDDNNNLVADYLSVYSGNAVPAYEPQLIVVYSAP